MKKNCRVIARFEESEKNGILGSETKMCDIVQEKGLDALVGEFMKSNIGIWNPLTLNYLEDNLLKNRLFVYPVHHELNTFEYQKQYM